MRSRRWVNRYTVAIVFGLIVGGAYVYAAYDRLGELNFDRTAAGVAGGTAATIICLVLLFRVAAPEAYLGELQDEKNTLITGLIFAVFVGAIWIAQTFQRLGDAPQGGNPAAWIYGSWGEAGDCSAPLLTVSEGANPQELVIEVGSARHTRRIVQPPTSQVVETDQGKYTRHPDGSMSTTEQRIENIRFTPCG